MSQKQFKRADDVAHRVAEGEVGAAPTPNQASVVLSESDVAIRAYFRWLERGCPENSAEQDWFEAERDLRQGRTGSNGSN